MGAIAASDIHAGPSRGSSRGINSRRPWCYPPDPRGIGQGAGTGINPCPVCVGRALSFVPHDGPNSLASCAALLRCLRRRRPCTWRRSFATSTAHRKPVRSHGSSPSPRRGMLFSRHRPRALSGESRREASNCRPGSRAAVPPFRVVSASGPDGDPHCALYARVRGGRGNRPPELPGLRRPYPGCLRGHDGAFTERSYATVPRLSASIVVPPCVACARELHLGPGRWRRPRDDRAIRPRDLSPTIDGERSQPAGRVEEFHGPSCVRRRESIGCTPSRPLRDDEPFDVYSPTAVRVSSACGLPGVRSP